MPEQKQSIGGLWDSTTKNGAIFLKGNIEFNGQKIRVVAWRNDRKKNDREPDWRMYVDDYEPNRQQSTPQQGLRDDQRPVTPSDVQPVKSGYAEDDLPF